MTSQEIDAIVAAYIPLARKHHPEATKHMHDVRIGEMFRRDLLAAMFEWKKNMGFEMRPENVRLYDGTPIVQPPHLKIKNPELACIITPQTPTHPAAPEDATSSHTDPAK